MSHSSHRARQLKLAILTSIGSKLATVILQVIVMPIAIRALGTEQFGVFVMISSGLTWMGMASVGLGNSLTISLAQEIVQGDLKSQRRVVSSAFFTVAGLCALILSVMIVIYFWLGVDVILGAKYAAYHKDIVVGFWIMVIYMIISLVVDVLEGVQAGHQELYIINLSGMLGQALAAMVLFTIILWHAQSIVNFIICLFVVAITPRVANAVQSVACARPYLLPRYNYFDRGTVNALLGTGIGISIMGIGFYIRQECGILMVGRMLGSVPVAGYSVVVTITMLASGMVLMYLRPFMPAVADAWGRGDCEWIRRTSHRILAYTMCYAILVGVVLATLGHTIISMWYGSQLAPSMILQITMGVGIALQAWETNHHFVLFGLGYIKPPAILYLIQNVVMIIISVPLIHQFGNAGASLAICITVASMGFWILPLMLRHALARENRSVVCSQL